MDFKSVMDSIFGQRIKDTVDDGLKKLVVERLMPMPAGVPADKLFLGSQAVCPDNVVDEKLVRRKR